MRRGELVLCVAVPWLLGLVLLLLLLLVGRKFGDSLQDTLFAGGGRAHSGTEKCIFKDSEHLRSFIQGFSGDSDNKQSSCNAGDAGS